MYFKVVSYFRKEFFFYIPHLIASDLDTNNDSYTETKIMDALRTKVDETWKKIESMYIQTILIQIRSELNIGFVSYFYSDLLDNEVDYFYKEKILPHDYESDIISQKK